MRNRSGTTPTIHSFYLRAANEELQSLNEEYRSTTAATGIPMLFLDRGLCIKRYTAPLRQLFNVKSHDLGRPIGDLTHNLHYDSLEQDVLKVLDDLVPVEKPVTTREGQPLIIRVRPYRTAEDKIDAVVVTFVR